MERGTPGEKLTRVYTEAAESLRGVVAGAQRRSPDATGTGRATFPGAFFDPHALVTATTVELWWGGASADRALVRLRSTPRSEIGL
jgi:hypothetical protein